MPLSTLAKSLVPTIQAADWKKQAAEAEQAQAALKKDKGDAKAKKTLKAYADEVDKLEGLLGKAVDAIEGKLGEVEGALDDIAKLTPMPDAIAKPLDKQRKILSSSRLPEIKDLRKEQKRASLRSNPSKIERLIGDLNADVLAANNLADAVDKATDAVFAEEIAAMRKAILAKLQAPVTGVTIMLDMHLKSFTAANQQKRWKGFDAARDTFMENRALDAAESLRKMQIGALNGDKEFAALEAKKRSKIIEAASKGNDSVLKARAELQAALTTQTELEAVAAKAAIQAQWTLKQKVWAKHLGMEGYGIVRKGDHDGSKIHITYDNNSWTQEAYKGVSVQLGDGSVEQIFKALFEVDWSYQFHATLELPNNSGDHPHIYAFGEENHKRWLTVAKDNKKDTNWITQAKRALSDVLDVYIKDVKKKIQKVIDDAPKK